MDPTVPAQIVVFKLDDPEDPRNWTPARKKFVVCILCALSFCSVFGSSFYAPGENQIRLLYGVNAEVATAGLALYVLGFALGPLLCPISEMFGRKLAYTIAWPLFIAVIAPSAWVENIVVILVFRLLAGCCSACFLNNGSGFISDMYSSTPRTLARAIGWYSFCPLSGPCFGTMLGFFVAAHSGRGLWVVRVHWFFVISLWPLVFILPETHGPTILRMRAEKMRQDGVKNAYAAHELHGQTMRQLVAGHLGRPTAMLLWEPINQGSAIWISLAYSIVYFFFEAFPVVFIEQKHIPFQLGGLPFIGINVGMIVSVTTYPYAVRFCRNIQIPFIDPPGGTPDDAPESTFKVVLLACGLMPVSLFWFAWTSGESVHWIVPTLAGIPFGYSMLSIFYSFSGYMSQTYKMYTTSAMACNTFVRSVIATAFTMLANTILNSLGTKWGVSLFGFLSFGLIPIPIIFIRYGPILRRNSRFARESQEILARMQGSTEEEAQETKKEASGDVEKHVKTEDKENCVRAASPAESERDKKRPISEA